MLQQESRLKVADNSGAKEVLNYPCFWVVQKGDIASVGDKIVSNCKRCCT